MAFPLIAAVLASTAGNIIAGNRAARASERAGNQAANAQLQSTRESNALQLQMFNRAQANQAPWLAAGTQALGQIQGFMGLPQTQPMQAPTAPGSAAPASVPANAPNFQPTAAQKPMQVSGAPGGAMQPDYAVGGGFMGDPNYYATGQNAIGAEREFGLASPFERMHQPEFRGVSTLPHGSEEARLYAANAGMAPGAVGVAQPPQQPQAAPVQQQGPQTAPQAPDPRSSFDNFLNSINYGFMRSEGENALSRMLARSGQLQSGRGLKAATEFNQNLAHTGAIMPYMNQLNLLAGIGQNSAMNTGAQGMALGQSMGANMMAGGNAQANALMNAGNARASAYQNAGNAFSNLVNQGAQLYGMNQAGYFNNQAAKTQKPGFGGKI